MAKTKAGNGRPKNHNNNNNYKNNNNDRNKKNLENGLYVHSSPPKAFNSNNGQGSASIRDYIRAADIEALEEVVLQGQGTKLVNQHATDQRVRNFLRTVPSYMSKIDLLHDAVEKGNLRDLKALLDRRKLARSKDAQGVGLLHKAVVHDHRAIVDYLISDFPETLEVTDNKLAVARGNTHTLETLQEVPEEQQQSLERTVAPIQVPPSTPTVTRIFRPSLLESFDEKEEEEEDEHSRDVAELKSSSGTSNIGQNNLGVGGLLEMARLSLEEGLELEVADWSESESTTCYESSNVQEQPQLLSQQEQSLSQQEQSLSQQEQSLLQQEQSPSHSQQGQSQSQWEQSQSQQEQSPSQSQQEQSPSQSQQEQSPPQSQQEQSPSQSKQEQSPSQSQQDQSPSQLQQQQSQSQPNEARNIFTPELSTSINRLLSRGRSGRLPHLISPMNSPELIITGKAIPRVTDHGQCVEADAVYPTIPSRSKFAYQNHLRRMATVRRRPMENDEKQMTHPTKPLTRHARLPDIGQRPRIKRRERGMPRPLTPTPSELSLSGKRRWSSSNTHKSDIAKNQLIMERLSSIMQNLSDSDSETESSNKTSLPGLNSSAKPQSNSRSLTSERPHNNFIPTPILTPTGILLENDSGIGSPNTEYNSRAEKSDNENKVTLGKPVTPPLDKKSKKYLGKITGTKNKLKPLKSVQKAKRDTTEDSEKVSFRNTGRNPRRVKKTVKSKQNKPSRLPGWKPGSILDTSSLESGQRSVKFAQHQSLELGHSDVKSEAEKPAVLPESPKFREVMLLENYAQASPSIQKYIRWLTSRILGESFADLKVVYAKAIKTHEEKKDIMNLVYDHDIGYWARVIVERILHKVVDSLAKYAKDDTLVYDLEDRLMTAEDMVASVKPPSRVNVIEETHSVNGNKLN